MDDPLFVASVVQILDRKKTVQDLYAVGQRLANEPMSDRDRQVLSQVFRDCKRCLTRIEFQEFLRED